MRRTIRLLFRSILGVSAIVLAIPVVGLTYGFAVTSDTIPLDPTAMRGETEGAAAQAAALEADKYLRPGDNTVLTYPEWSIVYAARDYQAFLGAQRESAFPYLAYAMNYWVDYARATRAASEFPFNGEYQVMLAVIGTSQTIEYLLQGAWENTVGRLTEALSGDPVAEDHVRAAVAAEYAAMLDQIPWYEFPYVQARARTWDATPATGAAAIRSWERKLSAGFADTVKGWYARLIKSGLAASGGGDVTEIAVRATGPVAAALADETGIRVVGEFGEAGTVFIAPRYQSFTLLVRRLAARGVVFSEIGSNRLIMVTVTGPHPLEALPAGAARYFAVEIPARPGQWRTGLLLPVDRMHQAFPLLAESGFEIEHFYDY